MWSSPKCVSPRSPPSSCHSLVGWGTRHADAEKLTTSVGVSEGVTELSQDRASQRPEMGPAGDVGMFVCMYIMKNNLVVF